MKQLLDALCNFDVEVEVNGTYGRLEKLGEGCYWLQPKRGYGFALEGEMLKELELSGVALHFLHCKINRTKRRLEKQNSSIISA